jgi:hypothetical protein
MTTKFEMQKGNVERLWSAFNLVDQDDELGDADGIAEEMLGKTLAIGLAGALASYAAIRAYRRSGSVAKALLWGAGGAAFPIPTLAVSWFVH